tara:strand:- start:14 stop:139 length:126 start_codon:yes stop_codon:yes gene_type:complete
MILLEPTEKKLKKLPPLVKVLLQRRILKVSALHLVGSGPGF